MSWLQKQKTASLWTGLATFLFCLMFVGLFVHFENERYREHLRGDIIRKAAVIRSKAEQEINTRIALPMGLTGYVSTNRKVFEKPVWFEQLACSMIDLQSGIRNIALLEDTTVVAVWPKQGNTGVLGVDIAAVPSQKEALERVKKTKKPVLAGPVKLIQGGEGFISRVAVYETLSRRSPNAGPYLGMVSIVIDKDTLIDSILTKVPDDMEIAIKGADGLGEQGKLFYGSGKLFEKDPIYQTIMFNGGSWQLMASPKSGWNVASPYITTIGAIGSLVSLVIAILVGMLVFETLRCQTAMHHANAASQAKSEFLSRMSHEIRTPMTAIQGFTTELKSSVSDNKAQEFVKIIDRNCDHLLMIVNDILDVARIESQSIHLHQNTFNPKNLIEDVGTSLMPLVSKKQLELTLDLDPTLPKQIEADETRIRQILVNLLGNAIKFTERGSIHLHVMHELVSSERADVVFKVSDTGIGIPQDKLDHIFEPFSMVDSSSSRVHGGTGLGLVICRNLCELMGGSLSVTSKLNQGSEFVARIQVELVPEVIKTNENDGNKVKPFFRTPIEVVVDNRNALSNHNVLVVDDGADNRKLIRFILNKEGATVAEAEHGQEALELIENSSRGFDVILLDMQMPVMDGYSTAKRLRELNIQTPIIALTAHAMNGEEQRCLHAGCDAYATKPIHRERLIAIIRKHTSRHLLVAGDPETAHL